MSERAHRASADRRVGSPLRYPPLRPRFATRLALLIALIVLLSADVDAFAGVVPGDEPGTERWVARYGGPDDNFDGATEVAVSPDGDTVYVTGDSNGPATGTDFATLAYDADDGTTLWTKRHDGPTGEDDFASSLGVSPDGATVFVAGSSGGTTGGLDYFVIGYDAQTGDRLWRQRYDGTGHLIDVVAGLAVAPDGSAVFVTGWSVGATSNTDVATLAIDPSSGAQLWLARYNRAGHSADSGTAITVTPDGAKVLVTGFTTRRGSNTDFVTKVYDASSGSPLWTKKFGGAAESDDRAAWIAVSPDGSRTFVTGYTTGTATGADYGTIAYATADGDRLWTKRYDGPGHGFDFTNGIAVDPGGARVYVTGQSDTDTTGADADFATLAYDAETGAVAWTQRHGGTDDGFDGAVAVATSPDGADVFVTGLVETHASLDNYTTLAYEGTTGSRLWDATYNGPGNGADRTFDLAVNPAGDAVFVTGFSRGEVGAEYATVSYAA